MTEDTSRPHLKNAHLYPILVKVGVNFPAFKKRSLPEHSREMAMLGPTQELWLQLIDGLTELDPSQRMGCYEAIRLLNKIEKIHLDN